MEAERKAAEAQKARQEAQETIADEIRTRESLARREIERLNKQSKRIRSILDGREDDWRDTFTLRRRIVLGARWLLIASLCVASSLLAATGVNAGIGLLVFFGTLAAFCMLVASRLFDDGREVEQRAVVWLTHGALQDRVRALDSELGPDAPAVRLEVDERGAA